MALYWINQQNSTGAPEPLFLKRFQDWAQIYMQVFGPATVRISNIRDDLVKPSSNGALQGIQIKQASGIVGLKWTGDFYIISSAQNTPVDIVVLEKTGFGSVVQPIGLQAPEQERQISYETGFTHAVGGHPGWDDDADDF